MWRFGPWPIRRERDEIDVPPQLNGCMVFDRHLGTHGTQAIAFVRDMGDAERIAEALNFCEAVRVATLWVRQG